MRVARTVAVTCVAAVASAVLAAQAQPDDYLSWPAKQAEAIGQQSYQKGRVGGAFDLRVLKTDRAYNYKLAATWLTPEVIRATARLAQLRDRLSDAETRALVKEAEAVGDTVVMVEIDPREGSGVIPNEWQAFLQPRGRPGVAVRGTIRPQLRDVKALAGVLRRNYDYDRFWVMFPLIQPTGSPLFSASDLDAEVVVRIYDKEGHVAWPIPSSLRESRPDREARLSIRP
jgi:hypothetical protein